MARTVTHDAAHTAHFGERDFVAAACSESFVSLVFELLTERTPTHHELAVFERILSLSIDHGPDTPSATVVRTRRDAGDTLGNAVGAGIAEINERHGGAQDALMPLLYSIERGVQTAESVVRAHATAGTRIPGYGHRIYETDPRAEALIETLRSHALGASYIEHALRIKNEIETQLGKRLPLNIDGAIAVVLCACGFAPALGSAVFIVARTAGLCGHYLNHPSP